MKSDAEQWEKIVKGVLATVDASKLTEWQKSELCHCCHHTMAWSKHNLKFKGPGWDDLRWAARAYAAGMVSAWAIARTTDGKECDQLDAVFHALGEAWGLDDEAMMQGEDDN